MIVACRAVPIVLASYGLADGVVRQVAWPTEWPADERAAAQLELKRFDGDGDGG